MTRSNEARGESMRAAKRKRLEAAGWRLGSAEEFLALTKKETALVELRLALEEQVKAVDSRIVDDCADFEHDLL